MGALRARAVAMSANRMQCAPPYKFLISIIVRKINYIKS